MPSNKNENKTVFVTLVRSPIGYTKDQKQTVLALGLRRMHQTIEHHDTPAVRGMIRKIEHLVKVEEAG
jgi:large subunit ribosomal protein L30